MDHSARRAPDSADEQRGADEGQALQIFADHPGEQNRGNRGHHKGQHRQAERMGQDGAVAALSSGEGGKKLGDASAKVDRHAENRAQLNHDGVHLPVAVGQANVQQRLRDAQVRRGADGQKLSQALDDSQQR